MNKKSNHLTRRELLIAGGAALTTVSAAAVINARETASKSDSATEEAAVRQAVLDYVEGVYDVDPSRIERSVHPEMAKRGFYVKRGETAYAEAPMTFAQLVELSKNYNKARKIPATAPKEIVIYEILDQTASIKLTAVWGIDYMHLAKYKDKWMIVNVLWQSLPKPAK